MDSIPFKVINGEIVFNKISLAQFVKANEGKGGDCVIRKSRRTARQNRALHLYCKLIADALNDAGYSVQMVLSQKMAIDWNMQLVKDTLWRDAQKKMFKIESTKNLTKQKQIDLIHEHLTRHLGEIFGIEYIQFPHHETEESFIKSTI